MRLNNLREAYQPVGGIGRGIRSSRSQLMGDGTSSNVPKDGGEVRSLMESVGGSDRSSCLNYDLIIPSS